MVLLAVSNSSNNLRACYKRLSHCEACNLDIICPLSKGMLMILNQPCPEVRELACPDLNVVCTHRKDELGPSSGAYVQLSQGALISSKVNFTLLPTSQVELLWLVNHTIIFWH